MRTIETLKNPRKLILDTLKDYTIEQLNKIPEGFNNNIVWNLGHIIASQQGICYKRSGLETFVSEDFFNTYKSGSKPERFISEQEYDEIKELLTSTLDKLEEDLEDGIFVNYTSVMTRYNVEITNIDEALSFLPFHDGLHIGYIMSLRKLV
ncbi:MAG: DinB family protein [Mucilaginibacter sp.]